MKSYPVNKSVEELLQCLIPAIGHYINNKKNLLLSKIDGIIQKTYLRYILRKLKSLARIAL